MIFFNFSGNSFELGSFSTIDEVIFIDTGNLFVRRNLNYVEGINLLCSTSSIARGFFEFSSCANENLRSFIVAFLFAIFEFVTGRRIDTFCVSNPFLF